MKIKNWLLVLGIISLLGVVGIWFKNRFWSQVATGALQVVTNPKARVWIDDREVGGTRYFDDKVASGERKVKLVAEEDDKKQWEGWVKINPGIVTVVNWDLAEDETQSAGEILSFEKSQEKDKGELAVVSLPDRAVVKIDGQPKGFAPLALSGLIPGKYQLTLALPGYEERATEVTITRGYRLIANLKLAQRVAGIVLTESEMSPSVTPALSPAPTPSPTMSVVEGRQIAKPYVVVKETPVGFLRVREDATSNSQEIGQVKPGQRFSYLNEKTQGWYKISFKDDKAGWVSGVYSQLVE